MASKAIGFLNFKFSADLSNFDRAMKKAQKNLKRFGKNIQKTGKSLTMGLTLPIVALGTASVKAFDEQQKALAQVEAGLKSTAGAVGITSEELQKMAADLQKTSLFGDEQILSDVTAQLLTFTGIAKEQFGETQLAVVNLSTKLKTDLKSTAIMVGKALNDPVTQLSALSRNGVRFTDDQKALINSLWEMGDAAGAQAIILKELETQFGGSAEAARNAGLGPIQVLQMQLSDLSEQIGARLIPYVKSFVSWIKRWAERFDGLSDSTKDIVVGFAVMLAALGPLLIIIGKMSVGLSALIPLFATLYKFAVSNPYLVLGAAIAGVAYAIYEVATALDSQGKAQKLLNDISREASSKISDQMAQIKELTGAIENETTSLDDKKKALNNLKELYPGYYEEVDEATFSQDAMKLSTDRLKGALMDLARLDVYTEKIKDLTSKQLELEDKIKENTKGQSTFQTAMGAVTTVLEESSSGFNILGRAMAGSSKESFEQTKELTELKKTIDDLINRKIELSEKTKDYNVTIKKVTHDTKDLKDETTDLTNDTKELTEETKEYDSSLDPLLANIKDYAENMTVAGASMEGVETWTRKLTLAQKLGAAGFQMFGDILTSSLDSALDSQENFFKVFIKNIKKAIRSLLVQLAVMTLIQAISPFGAVRGKSAFKLSNIKSNLADIMNVQLAEGGLVTGPTTALIGEGVGTTASNPEVVAPLDKLKSMIGGGNQNITVTGKLIGNDIFLSNSKTGFNRKRTV